MKDKGLVFDIQGFSVHDGPGTRTLVFFSGCPLNCEWCANPEGKEISPCLLYVPVRCRAVEDGCRRCAEACASGGAAFLKDRSLPVFNRNLCKICKSGECTKACLFDALRISGKYYTIKELMNILTRDKRFWGDGGVTFGGGEPLMQGEFLIDLLHECKKTGMHTAIETCGYAEEALFLNAMEYLDFAFVDIKHMNPELHKRKTGVTNEVILNNLRAFSRRKLKGTRLILRMPVIPKFNDSFEHAEEAAVFMKENHFYEINLLPFHRMGTSKWEQLGLSYPYRNVENQNPESLSNLQRIYLDQGIACYVDADVLY